MKKKIRIDGKKKAKCIIWSNNHPFGQCPTCKEDFNSELVSEYCMKYCINCGQKLK